MHNAATRKGLAALIGAGRPLKDAAEEVGVPYRTAARWASSDVDFKVEVRIARAHHNVERALGGAYDALRGDRNMRPDALPIDGNIIGLR